MGTMKDSSPDTAKENASVVGSSMTECKQDRENCDDPDSSYKEDDDCYPDREELPHSLSFKKKLPHSFDGVRNSRTLRNEKLDTRYFIIKSLNHHNIQLSIEKGIWATQVMNEPILEEAFNNSSKVILIFSVNMSGFFQGYAQMMSSVGWRRDNVWSESSGRSNPWGRTFKVKWLRLHDLPFQETLQLKNPLNDYKPVKISRDCQELSQDVGEALCGLIDGKVGVDERLKRNNVFRDEFILKRPCLVSPVPSQDEDCVLSGSPSHVARASAPMLHPSLLYQHAVLADAHTTQITRESSSGRFVSKHLASQSEAPKGPRMKHSRICGNPVNRQGKKDMFFETDNKDLFDERSPFSDSLSEDDILDMTYEEYLQLHGRHNETSHHVAAGVGPSWTTQVPSTSAHLSNDGYSKYLDDWYRSQNKNSNSKYYHSHH
ncbi:YTH family protein isoform X2 [Tasmannia lanceolata]|uniref:YTH family protein isoform X2 n=2 Tax=Tasmannia lanceolata TaxID=3420 RepID=UPI00406437D2